jgi:hypothetical protein
MKAVLPAIAVVVGFALLVSAVAKLDGGKERPDG